LLAGQRLGLALVAADGAAVVDHEVDVGVAVGARALDLEQVGRLGAAPGHDRRAGEGEREDPPPHTTTSRAPAVSRRKRGVDMTAPMRRSASARSTPAASSAAAQT